MSYSRREWLLTTIAGLAGASSLSVTNAGQAKKAGHVSPIPVAIVLGPNATLIDFAGPWEVLGAACYVCPGFNVYSVADSLSPVLCDDARSIMGGRKPASGPRIIPDYTFRTAPQPRIVVVGAQPNPTPAAIAWIRNAAKKAELTASVCTGAFVLAKTGLLDGKRATTNRNAYDAFQKSFPAVTLVRGVRFLDDGNVATATGLTAGIDLAVHIVERFYGAKAARDVAAYEEWAVRT
jgi:transcriptional regulator GlxA family with amidase domain